MQYIISKQNIRHEPTWTAREEGAKTQNNWKGLLNNMPVDASKSVGALQIWCLETKRDYVSEIIQSRQRNIFLVGLFLRLLQDLHPKITSKISCLKKISEKHFPLVCLRLLISLPKSFLQRHNILSLPLKNGLLTSYKVSLSGKKNFI